MKKNVKPRKFVASKEDRNGTPWEPDFQYECDGCGCIVSPPSKLERLDCPVYIKGERCTGKLIRFGKGTGRGAHFRKAVSA